MTTLKRWPLAGDVWQHKGSGQTITVARIEDPNPLRTRTRTRTRTVTHYVPGADGNINAHEYIYYDLMEFPSFDGKSDEDHYFVWSEEDPVSAVGSVSVLLRHWELVEQDS